MTPIGRLLRTTALLTWLSICFATALIWAVGTFHLMPRDHHLAGRWSFQASETWPGKVSLLLFHDAAAPDVGPQMDSGPTYNAAALKWLYKRPVDVYHSRWGFDRDVSPNFAVDAADHIVLRGTLYRLRMPDWFAIVTWLPLAVPTVRRWHRRRMIRRGHCGNCFYDLTANTSGVCPECGTSVFTDARQANNFREGLPRGDD